MTPGYWVGIKNEDGMFIFVNDAVRGEGAKWAAAGCTFFITHGLCGSDTVCFFKSFLAVYIKPYKYFLIKKSIP